MKLWELRSYDQVIKLEQERLVYQARLRSRFGRAWRRKAPVESLMPLRLARYGVPLAGTAPEGLAAAGIEIPVLLPAPAPAVPAPAPAAPQSEQRPQSVPAPRAEQPGYEAAQEPEPGPEVNPWLHARDPQQKKHPGGYNPDYKPAFKPEYTEEHLVAWYEQEEQPLPEESPLETTGSFPIPSGPGRTRELGEGGGPPEPNEEDFYLVFKKSIDGSYPTSGQLRDDVKATYSITLAQRDADRMVNRFTNRHTAELQEDHIA